jgi:penicillin-binding protein 2
MANYVATIANGGYRNKLTLVDNIKNYNNTKTLYKHEIDQERIELNNYENLEHIKKGMGMVSSDGSARRVFEKFPIKVATKTGTAERSGINPSTGDTFDDFAWFVGFAPFDEPEIAVAAVIFQGGSGGYAGPMVRDIIAEYLGLNGLKSRETLPYENVLQN